MAAAFLHADMCQQCGWVGQKLCSLGPAADRTSASGSAGWAGGSVASLLANYVLCATCQISLFPAEPPLDTFKYHSPESWYATDIK